MDDRASRIRIEPDPENPGWLTYDTGDRGRYNDAVIGPLIMRAEGPMVVRVRLKVLERHLNMSDMIHGGTLLGFADVSLFAALQLALGVDPVTSLTIDLQCQFLAGGIPSESIDSVVEVLRETRRMAFLRGTMVQGDHRVAAFSATVRK